MNSIVTVKSKHLLAFSTMNASAATTKTMFNALANSEVNPYFSARSNDDGQNIYPIWVRFPVNWFKDMIKNAKEK